jgi:hypothetical protein
VICRVVCQLSVFLFELAFDFIPGAFELELVQSSSTVMAGNN